MRIGEVLPPLPLLVLFLGQLPRGAVPALLEFESVRSAGFDRVPSDELPADPVVQEKEAVSADTRHEASEERYRERERVASQLAFSPYWGALRHMKALHNTGT